VRAALLLALISRLYDVERDAKNLGEAGRWALRQKRSRAIIEQIRGKVAEFAAIAIPKSPMGTLGDADETFDLLVTELLLRGASKAKEIIMTADGARWIWDRADDLARSLGVAPESIVKVADFYHGVEHLSRLVQHCTSLPEEKRSRWVKRMRRRLKRGSVAPAPRPTTPACS